MTSILHDLRYAARMLRRRPGSALLAVATMGLGVGATTILFSVAWNVLAKPLPWPDADRLVRVIETRQGSTRRLPPIMTNGSYLAWREGARTIEEIAAWAPRAMTVQVGGAAEPRRARVVTMTASAFKMMGAQPLAGRVFAEADEAAGNAAVISHLMWQQEFGGAPEAVGRAIHLDGQAHTIVGVMPATFAFPDRETRVWVPLFVRPVIGADGQSRFISLFGAMAKLKPGVTPSQAAHEATARARGGADPGMTAIAVFGSRGPVEISAVPVIRAMTADVRDGILVMLLAVGLLLVTATANIASVQLARSAARRGELAVRAALGASGGRLARQLLLESLVIGAFGGIVGIALAAAIHQTLPTLLPPDFPRVNDLALDWRVFLFASAVSLAASVGFGLIPAIQVRGVNLAGNLAARGWETSGTHGRMSTARMRAAIMAVQVAIACVLIVGASLLVRSFAAMVRFDRGFETSDILTARLPLPDASFTPARRATLVENVLQRLRSRPEVTAAAMTSVLPLTDADALMGFTLPPRRGGDEPRQVQAAVRTVTVDYFRTLGMRVVEGRGFSDGDTPASLPIVVVNREFARRYLDNTAVGSRLPLPLRDPPVPWEIAGVIDDTHTRSVVDRPQPELFSCVCQAVGITSDPLIVVRTRGTAEAFAPSLRQVVKELEPSVALDAIVTMDQRLMGNLARPRLYAVVLGGFAGFALAICAVGLFGVLSYSVAQRSREIGVRTALGASPADIIRLVVREALVVTAAGLIAGLAAAFVMARSISSLLFGIVAHDALTFTAVPLLLIVVSALACAMPARRAAKLDPLQVLKTS